VAICQLPGRAGLAGQAALLDDAQQPVGVLLADVPAAQASRASGSRRGSMSSASTFDPRQGASAGRKGPDTYDWIMSVGGPSIADWLAAIGTEGTLGATVALFWIDRYQRRMREDRSQAALISGWSEPVRPGDATRALKVANLSTEPLSYKCLHGRRVQA
jgi:hypothetical protein